MNDGSLTCGPLMLGLAISSVMWAVIVLVIWLVIR